VEVGLAGALPVNSGKQCGHLLVAESLELKEVLPIDEAQVEVGVFLRLEKEFIDALECSPYFKLTFCLDFPQMMPIVVAKI